MLSIVCIPSIHDVAMTFCHDMGSFSIRFKSGFGIEFWAYTVKSK